jgi:molecular chaperone Hsp33
MMVIMMTLPILRTTRAATATSAASFVSLAGHKHYPKTGGVSSVSSSSITPSSIIPYKREFLLRKGTPRILWASSRSGKDETVNGSASDNDDTATDNIDDKDDALAEFRNRLNHRDQVFSAISGDGGIKVTVCTVRNLINDLLFNNYQQSTTAASTTGATSSSSSKAVGTGSSWSSPLTMTAIPTDALGRTMICALLMANGIQKEQMVQITINGNGPLRGVVAICTGDGQLRGYVGTPQLGGDGVSTTIQNAVGTKGSVQVVKNHPDWPRPYNGITAIRHGDIDRDVGLYLAESEQRSCALAAATALTTTSSTTTAGNSGGEVLLCNAAGGYLIEQLPGVSKETVAMVERNLAMLVELDGSDKLPTNLLLQGRTPLDIASILLHDLDLQPLGQMLDPALACECTEERLWRALSLLPATEVQEILDQEQKVEARCQFCGREYRIGSDAVRERLFSREQQERQ